MSNVTITGIAKETNLSTATVSRVLSGSDYPVKLETRKKIMDAAEKVGYVPNMLARGLKTRHSNEIAVIVPYIHYPFFYSIVTGIETVLAKSAFNMSLHLTRSLNAPPDSLASRLVGNMVAGVIITTDSMPQNFYNVLLGLNQKNGLPVITMDYELKEYQFPGVYFDYFAGAKMALEYLFDKGHRQIAFASCPITHETRKARWAGVQDACKAWGHKTIDLFTDEVDYDYFNDFHVGASIARKIIKNKKKYTAIAASNDTIAIGLMVELTKQGIRVPEDISIIGFDDSSYSMMTIPALTTIRIPAVEMGEKAAHAVLDAINKKETPTDINLGPRVIERSSVKPLH